MGEGQALASAAIALPAEVERGRRISWIDATRGIGIFLVVLAHAERGFVEAGMMPLDPAVRDFDGAIYAFHMPLFFLLAGLHVEQALAAGRPAFLTEKLKAIAWPYLLWSTLHVLTVMATGSANRPLDLHDLAGIGVRPVAQFWFLYALFLCCLVVAAGWGRFRLLTVIAGTGIAAHAYFGSGNMILQTAQLFPFFLMGIAVGRWPAMRGEYLDTPTLATILLGGALIFAATRLLQTVVALGGADHTILFYVGAGAGIAMTTTLAIILRGRMPWLVRLGQASMAIYVAHTFFTAGFRMAVQKMGLALDPAWLLAIGTIVGLLGPLGLYEFAGRRKLSPILGLGKYVRS